MIELVNLGWPMWFTHSIAEGLQYVRAIKGEVEVPDRWRPFIIDAPTDETPFLSQPEFLCGLDLVLVEVSTLREAEVEGLQLHIPRVWGEAQRLGLDPRAAADRKGVDWPDEHPLRGLTVTYPNEAHMFSLLQRIGELCSAPIATVDHLYALDANGAPVTGRDRITSFLEAVQEREGIPFLPTRPLIEAHGQEKALKDSAHYNTDFEPVAADYFRAFLERAYRVIGA